MLSRIETVSRWLTNMCVDMALCMSKVQGPRSARGPADLGLRTLIAHGLAALPRIGGAQQPTVRTHRDSVRIPEIVPDVKLVAPRPQQRQRVGREAGFDADAVGQPLVVKARGVNGLLHAHLVVYDAQQDVQHRADNLGPPGLPTTRTNLPSRVTTVGVMFESGRFPGAMLFASP